MARTYKRAGRWTLDYVDASGQRVRKTAKAASTKSEAESALRLALGKVERERLYPELAAAEVKAETGARPFGELLDSWYEMHGKHLRSTAWKYMLERVRTKLGKVPAGSITPAAIQAYYHEIAAASSVSTANRYHCLISSVFARGKEWGLVACENPAKAVRKKREPNHRTRFLTQDEIKRLLDAAHPRLRPFLFFLLFTGCRRGEVMALDWKDVDLPRATVLIIKSKSGKSRYVPLPRPLVEVLQALEPRTVGPVFDLPLISITRFFVKAVTTAGLPTTGENKVTLHVLRHSFASYLVMAGVDIYTVSRLLGHASVSTSSRYSHLSAPHMAAAVSRLEGVVPSSSMALPVVQAAQDGTTLAHALVATPG